ncbi:N-acetyltransferase [Aerococcus loyolae]|uniref:GNAT family N-acetyltransferase n=2 Tax=Aerococcus TaxID=1375 RepID=A0A2I1L952_9LACT|nr:GNAT family N-acetyltransferase [Aerococcus loyolae]KAA9266367.1 GNAT family N-acetyltransferase [Aerococcus loyolae]PKY87060.1 N-acetyltransferase [Aerococcus loyolae]PKZ04405.1 N-acetyltransferase [Aerococcus loyolae]RAV67227.1 GNAT family N-acetyltransferase [Aerococcus loyolae]
MSLRIFITHANGLYGKVVMNFLPGGIRMEKMQIRLAKPEDLPAIQAIIKAGAAYLRQQKIDQWQDPTVYQADSLLKDIEGKNAYLGLIEEDVAGFFIARPMDRDYENYSIWQGQGDYLAFHRVALATKYRGQGLSRSLFQAFEDLAYHLNVNDLRIDTHPDNHGMQNIILKAGYQYLGEIELAGSGRRYAYEKIIPTKKSS